MHRRTLFIGVASAAAGVLLGACGGSSVPTRITTPVSVTATPTVSPAATRLCKAGLHTVHHTLEHAFCGPAQVRFAIRGHEVTATGGRCVLAPSYVAVHIGTVVLGKSRAARTARHKFAYFVALAGRLPGDRSGKSRPARHDGRATVSALNASNHGPVLSADLTPRQTLVLAQQRTVGHFNLPLHGKGRIRGTWRCLAA